MIEMDVNHCEVVAKSLRAERAVDEQTFASLAILGERLERLKKTDEIFEGIGFSSAAEKLLSKQRTAVTVV